MAKRVVNKSVDAQGNKTKTVSRTKIGGGKIVKTTKEKYKSASGRTKSVKKQTSISKDGGMNPFDSNRKSGVITATKTKIKAKSPVSKSKSQRSSSTTYSLPLQTAKTKRSGEKMDRYSKQSYKSAAKSFKRTKRK